MAQNDVLKILLQNDKILKQTMTKEATPFASMLPVPYAVGDILYASSSTVLSRLADVAAGSYLRSGGVTTAPLWSTLKLPNAATTGDLFYASASNTMDVLADVAAGRYLRSGGVTTAPLWSTLSLPNSATTGDILYASGSNAIGNLADVATGNVLRSGGVGAAPAYGKVTLTTDVTGTLPVANGGTGVTVMPAFFAHKNGTDQTGIVTATATKVTFSTETFDTNNNFASSTFTPTVAGKYMVVASVFWTTTVDQSYGITYIYKNGTNIVENVNRSSSALDFSTQCSAIIDMNGSSDTLECYAYQNTGSNKTIGGAAIATYFCASWIAP